MRQKCRTLWCPQSLQAALHCERWTEISNPLARARTARAKFEPCVAKPDRAPKKSNPSRALRSATNSRCFFLEPFARSEPKKSNLASQRTEDVQKTRTLRPPDLSKVHLGAGGEKNKFFDLKVFLGNRFFRPGNSPIFRLVTAPARNFEHSGAQLQAAPRWKQAGKRRTLRPPVPEFRTPMSIGGALAKFEPS